MFLEIVFVSSLIFGLIIGGGLLSIYGLGCFYYDLVFSFCNIVWPPSDVKESLRRRLMHLNEKKKIFSLDGDNFWLNELNEEIERTEERLKKV